MLQIHPSTKRKPARAAFTLIELLAARGVARRAKRSIKGFTLIELLVVIAIIAVLAGLLLPAVTEAMDRGRELACKSNIRQMGQASIMYEADTGFFPAATGDFGGIYWWLNVNTPYLDMPTYSSGLLEVRPSALTCPTQYRIYNQEWTYSINMNFHTRSQGIDPPGSSRHVSRELMTRSAYEIPSRWPATETSLPLFMDGHADHAANAYWHARHGGMDWRCDNDGRIRSYPHSLGANLLFLDGHVEKMGRGESATIFAILSNSYRARYLDGAYGF